MTQTAWETVPPSTSCTSPDGHEEQRLWTGRSEVPVSAFCGLCSAEYAVVTWEHERDVLREAPVVKIKTFYLLACLVCEPPLPMPFGSAQERGRWAAAHRDGAGHDTWRVWDETRPVGSAT